MSADGLFHTVEGEALCTHCKILWADEQAHAARTGAGAMHRPGFRLVCPSCDLATMTVRENEGLRIGECLRCGHTTTQLRGGVFLLAALGMMGAITMDIVMGTRFALLGLVVAGVLALVVHDQVKRRRHRVASVDEIDQADLALKAERKRLAADALRIADSDASAAAELEAQAEAEPSSHRNRA